MFKTSEITIKAKIPKELQGSEKEIEQILKRNMENLIKKLETLKKSEGILKTEKSWQELEAEIYEDIS